MTDQFFTWTKQYVDFTEADEERIASALKLRQVPAKTELVTFDRRSDELFFILEGCVRKYHVKDGEQLTIYIMTENNFIGSFGSFISGTKSKETIECLEDCKLLVLNKKDLTNLYLEVPLMNEFIRKILENTLIQFQDTLRSFILDNPEERYIKVLSQNPHLLQRVPQHMLATYLGITATSLSRIRKRILGKD